MGKALPDGGRAAAERPLLLGSAGAIIGHDRTGGLPDDILFPREKMREYELVLVISPELSDEQVSATVERVQRFISERGGEVVKLDRWGRRRLAYPIQRHTEGHYVVTQFRLDGAAVRELNRSLEVSEPVLRHLVVRTDEGEEE